MDAIAGQLASTHVEAQRPRPSANSGQSERLYPTGQERRLPIWPPDRRPEEDRLGGAARERIRGNGANNCREFLVTRGA